MQFAGAPTVVLDLVKAERHRTWGKRMRGRPFGDNVKDWAAESAPLQGTTVVQLLRRSAVGILGVGLGFLVLLFVLSFLRELGPYALAFGLVFGFWWLLLQILDFGFARPVAWVLDRNLPGQPLRWLGVALLVLGFHFDLLAS